MSSENAKAHDSLMPGRNDRCNTLNDLQESKKHLVLKGKLMFPKLVQMFTKNIKHFMSKITYVSECNYYNTVSKTK